MQSVVLAVLVCAVAAQYYQQNQVPTPNNQVQPTRFSQYNTQYGNQQQYGQQQYGQPSYTSSAYNNNLNSQYGTTAGYNNNNNRMYDTQTQRYYNGVSTSSAVMAFTAAAVALVL